MMKKLFLSLLLIMGITANAQAVPVKINSLNCSGTSSAGFTVINNIQNTSYGSFVTISNMPLLGLPFVQQAKITGGNYAGKNFDLKLHTQMTNQDLTLRLEDKSRTGYLIGANGQALVLNCQASVTK